MNKQLSVFTEQEFRERMEKQCFPSLLQSAENERRRQLRDYEPEQAYGTAEDFREHQRYGGTREDY